MPLKQLTLILFEKSIILLSEALEKEIITTFPLALTQLGLFSPYNFAEKARNFECFNVLLNTIPSSMYCYSQILALLCY